LTWKQLRPALTQFDSFLSDSDVLDELTTDSSSGFPHVYQGCRLKKDWISRVNGDVIRASKDHFRTNIRPVVYKASMKGEAVPLSKYLMRKQRMFMIMPVHAVVLHKHYFSRQSKALRKFREIAHGKTFFFGAVTRLARQLEGSDVASEDDTFWDKRFVFMHEVYKLRMRGLTSGNVISDDDSFYINSLIECLENPLVLLPTGDVIKILGRTNPSGADATTENNCIARLLVENYAVLTYCQNLGPLDFDPLVERRGTQYLGDDRIAASKAYPDGYFGHYPGVLAKVGVQVKILEITKGPIGAEFAGFRITRSWWDPNTYLPLYKMEKIWYGLFVTRDKDINITVSRLMAFAFLVYPHYSTFTALKPIVVDFLRDEMRASEISQIALDFWLDEVQIQRMWTGLEADAEPTRCFAIVNTVLEAEVYF